MYKLFTPENPMIRFLTKVCDIILLNVIFVISCIPVFTIGAALCSLYYNAIKILTDQTNIIFPTYIEQFKKNFKRGTIMWILTILTNCGLVLVFTFIKDMGTIAVAGFAVLCVLVYMVIVFAYPLQALFENTLPEIIRNAFLLSVSNFPYAFSMVLIPFMVVCVCFKNVDVFGETLMVFLLLGFALVAVIQSYLLRTCLKKRGLLPEVEAEDEEEF